MGKADKEKTEKTSKKQKHFWKDFKAELKKVIWPTRSQVVKNTIIVIVMVIIITAIVFVLDLVFEAFNTYGIDKLKTTVQNSVTSEDENVSNGSEDNVSDDSAENNSEDNDNAENDVEDGENNVQE